MRDQFLQYTQQLTLCMLKYQYIEFALRGCLVRFHATVRFRLAGYLPYAFPLDAIEGAALGLLVKWFKSFSDNTELVRKLNKLKTERDQLAHQGFIFSCEEQSDDSLLIEKTKELAAANERAEACLAELHPELERAEFAVQSAYAALRAKCEAKGISPPEAFKLPPFPMSTQNKTMGSKQWGQVLP